MDTTAPHSDTVHIANELTCYHEAGHAVMAHIFGRLVDDIVYELNVEGHYNGRTHWGREAASMRKWDQYVPYDELRKFGLEKEKESDNGVALIIAAGKAAERIWYPQRGLDEAQANYGIRSTYDDESELEQAIFEWYQKRIEPIIGRLKPEERPLKPDELVKGMQMIEDLAMRLLEEEKCWMVVKVVAQASLRKLEQGQQQIFFTDAQELMEKAFAQAALNEKIRLCI